MNGYKIVLLKAIFMLYKLPESERVCSRICSDIDICLGHVRIRTDHIQLFIYYATSHVCYVVLHADIHLDEWIVYPH